jgi:ribosomal protein L40E
MNTYSKSKYGGSEMRASNFGKGRRAAFFFRLCLGIIVSLTLAMGGMALNTQPVQAALFDILPLAYNDNVTECMAFSFSPFSTGGSSCIPGPGPAQFIYYWGSGNPAWVTVDNITGAISGCVPLATPAGPVPFQVGATELYTDNISCLSGPEAHFSVNNCNVILTVIANAPPPLIITPTIPPVAWEGMPYTTTLAATGCSGNTTNYNWGALGLPAGLVLDPASGIISGTPAPGTCGGPYTVTVTCTDTSMCPTAGCCLPATAPLYLYVDCWGNYLAFVTTYTTTTACDFTVNIGSGLAYGTTNVVIDGNPEATLAGNGTEIFTSVPCESHLVVVDQTVQGADSKTRYACIGSNQKWVSDVDNVAYFDYAPEIWIDTGSDPAGVAQPPGAGFYAAGAGFSSSAPSPVQLSSQPGTKYLFRQWSLPDGSTNPNRDLWFTVTNAGKATALYDTYYELILKSDLPAVLEKSWEPAGSDAMWNLALQPIPFSNIFGTLGGVYEPTNAQGNHNMTGPYTQQITWRENWFWPIFWIVVALLAIAAAIFFGLSRRRGTAAPAGGTAAPVQPPPDTAATTVKAATVEVVEPKSLAKAAPEEPIKMVPPLSAAPDDKKALSEAEAKDKPNFCPKCGDKVPIGATFCKNCGAKL